MQQLPPFPDDAPGFEPTPPEHPAEPNEPAQPSIAPDEAPPAQAPIDVPSPSSPGTESPTTPISPIG
jgi:hypothetical protein